MLHEMDVLIAFIVLLLLVMPIWAVLGQLRTLFFLALLIAVVGLGMWAARETVLGNFAGFLTAIVAVGIIRLWQHVESMNRA